MYWEKDNYNVASQSTTAMNCHGDLIRDVTSPGDRNGKQSPAHSACCW